MFSSAIATLSLKMPEQMQIEEQADGIWIIDENARTLYANSAMGEILGTAAEEMMGKSSFSYLYPEDEPAAQRLFEAKRLGKNSPFRFRLRRKDGRAIWVEVQGTPMHGTRGEFIGVIGTFSVRNGSDHGK